MEVIFRVTGIVFETTAKFPITCNPINDEIITITPINPHSSANIAKMKSFCGSGI